MKGEQMPIDPVKGQIKEADRQINELIKQHKLVEAQLNLIETNILKLSNKIDELNKRLKPNGTKP